MSSPPPAPSRPPRPIQIRLAALLLGLVGLLWTVVIVLAAHDLSTFDDYVREAEQSVPTASWQVDDAIFSNLFGNLFVMLVAGLGIGLAVVSAINSLLARRAGLVIGAVGAGLQTLACAGASCVGWFVSTDRSRTGPDSLLDTEALRLEELGDPAWIRPAWATTAALLMVLGAVALLLLLTPAAKAYAPARVAPTPYGPYGPTPGHPLAPGQAAGPYAYPAQLPYPYPAQPSEAQPYSWPAPPPGPMPPAPMPPAPEARPDPSPRSWTAPR